MFRCRTVASRNSSSFVNPDGAGDSRPVPRVLPYIARPVRPRAPANDNRRHLPRRLRGAALVALIGLAVPLAALLAMTLFATRVALP